MLRETQMPVAEYVQVLRAHLPSEHEDIILNQVTSTITGVRGERTALLNDWPQKTEQDRAARQDFIVAMETEYFKRFKAAPAGSDEHKFWFDNFSGLAQTRARLIN